MNEHNKEEPRKNFERLLGKVLSVPKEKLDEALEQEKREKQKPRPVEPGEDEEV